LKFIDLNGDSIVKIIRQGNKILIENSPNPGEEENYFNTITLNGQSIKQGDISDYSVSILNDAMIATSESSLTITSGKRNSKHQARIMYNNLEGSGEGKGLAAQKKLYGKSPGGKVIEVYESYKEYVNKISFWFPGVENTVSSTIKSAMENKINELGPSNVSNHCSNDPNLNVFDIEPRSLSNYGSFQKTLKADVRVRKLISYPKDPGIHVEIEND
jgi:hypothetical protein